MKPFLEKIHGIAQEAAASIGVKAVKVEYLHAGTRTVLRVVIHREGGTSIQDCERVSRAVEQELDVLDLIPGRYSLEVRSRGIEGQPT